MSISAKPIHIIFTVTNDLVFDQRMARICSTLSGAGYAVTLVGRKLHTSLLLSKGIPYKRVRLSCFFTKKWMFYAEFNTRLFFYLLFCRADIFCAIDLDTILPCLFASRIRSKKRVYDAHELFCEMKEVVTRPRIYRFWKKIEQYAVPKFIAGYTVSNQIASEFRNLYHRDYTVVMNTPVYQEAGQTVSMEKFILYQGAVNEGRCFETLIPAMKDVLVPLIICGDGNFMQKARELVAENGLQQKVLFKGMLEPAALKEITKKATLGITLFEPTGKSNYFSLANRFFDYLHAGVPQICVDFPAYHEINNEYAIAVLLQDLSPASIGAALNNLLQNPVLYQSLKQNCLAAAKKYNWQEEEKKLIRFYANLLSA